MDRPPGDEAVSAFPRHHRSASVSQVAWLALELADDDAVRWLMYVIAALARIDSRIGQQASTLSFLHAMSLALRSCWYTSLSASELMAHEHA